MAHYPASNKQHRLGSVFFADMRSWSHSNSDNVYAIVVDRRIRAVSSPRRTESDFGDRSPSLRTPSPSPSTSSSSYSVVTLAHAKSQSGPPNSIFHAIIEAVDKNALVYSQLLDPNEPAPSSDVIRPLVRHYLRYVHPFHRIIDEHDPQFWTRMDQPMAPEVATIVYAMCTLGAIFASKDSTSGTLDNVVHDFHKRTLAVKCERPEDIVTIQTLLILQEFYVVTNQMDMGTKTFQNMLDIADAIKLKDMVKRISTQDKLSPGDAIIRNIWRMIVWTETLANIVSMRTARIEVCRMRLPEFTRLEMHRKPSDFMWMTVRSRRKT